MHDPKDILESTTRIAVAIAGSAGRFSPADIGDIYAALADTGKPAADIALAPGAVEYEPAVSVRKSLASPDHIISMIDGKPYKTLRRHLTTHGMTPAEYRERYGLKPDYPIVAPNYSAARKAMAHKIGLGTKGNKPA